MLLILLFPGQKEQKIMMGMPSIISIKTKEILFHFWISISGSCEFKYEDEATAMKTKRFMRLVKERGKCYEKRVKN